MKKCVMNSYKKMLLLFLMTVALQPVKADFNAVELTKQVKGAAERVRPAVVSVFKNGWGSGVVISQNGLIATAGHMLLKTKTNDVFTVTFSDGRELDAKILGYNLDNDTALLKLPDPGKDPYPFVRLQKETPAVGDFCFTLAHPAGLKEGRPAQLRLGRITMVQQKDGRPWLFASDTEIQPGDSGGPLFDVTGKLIGIDSSAAGNRRFNRFATVARLNEDMAGMLAGKRIGAIENGPSGVDALHIDVEPRVVTNLITEFQARLLSNHRPTVEFIRKLAAGSGELTLDEAAVVHFMVPEVYAETDRVPYCMGLADPKLVDQLPKLPYERPVPLAVFADGRQATYAVRISKRYLAAKMSKIPKAATNILLRVGDHGIPLSRRAENSGNDLVLLKIIPAKLNIKTPLLKLTDAASDIEAGDGLIAVDDDGLRIWGVASDSVRSVEKRITIGPLDDDKELISEYRAPFAAVIAHDLRLYDQDTGIPVFDFKGNCIGIHHARLSRTLGLILPVEVLREIIPAMIRDSDAM